MLINDNNCHLSQVRALINNMFSTDYFNILILKTRSKIYIHFSIDSFTIKELIVFFIYIYLNHVSNLPVDGICDVNFSISIIHSPHNINTSLGVDLNLEDCNFFAQLYN